MLSNTNELEIPKKEKTSISAAKPHEMQLIPMAIPTVLKRLVTKLPFEK
jgi:hypothetical protein